MASTIEPAVVGEGRSRDADHSPTSASSLAVVMVESPRSSDGPRKKNQLSLIPLIFMIFFEVSGGPYGEEPTVEAAGPLLAILGFLIFPFVWSIPEALITAELATAFPGNGGYVTWAAEAFGPFPGSMMGSWKYLSGVVNNAAYPILCADYLSRVSPRFGNGGGWRDGAIIGFTLSLSLLNYTGLRVVGWGGVALGTVALAPFLVMGAVAIPKIHPGRWLRKPETRMRKSDWSLYFNTLFWNLNYWDNVSTMAGEVRNPQRTFPVALLGAGVMTCLGYLIPLFAATGSLDVSQEDWVDGYLADAAGQFSIPICELSPRHQMSFFFYPVIDHKSLEICHIFQTSGVYLLFMVSIYQYLSTYLSIHPSIRLAIYLSIIY